MARYDVGDVARLTAKFTTLDETVSPPVESPVNPTTVELRVKDPAGVTTTVSHTNPVVGTFQADVPLPVSGVWRYRWTSTGVGSASEESWFEVRPRTVF